MTRFGRISQFAFAVLVMMAGIQTARARILEHWPIDYLVLKSELIVQGRVEKGFVVVDKVILGESSPGARVAFTTYIDVPFTTDQHCDSAANKTSWSVPCRNWEGSTAVVFLYHNRPDSWEVTGEGSGLKWLDGEKVLGYCQFSNPGPYTLCLERETKTIQDLTRLVNAALEKRSRYFTALKEPDPQKRIQQLRLFLTDSRNYSYWQEAIHSIAAIGPLAGTTLRELAAQPSDLRSTLIAAMGEAGDPDCVPFLASLVEKARPFLTDLKFTVTVPDPRLTFNEWQAALCALAKINSPKAHKVLLESMSEWPTAEESYAANAAICVQQGLNKFPRAEDLVYFQKVYPLYPRWFAWERSGSPWASWWAMGFLEAHKFKEAIPLLVQQLDHPDAATRDEAARLLREIVGSDLGKSKEPWMNWYARNVKQN